MANPRLRLTDAEYEAVMLMRQGYDVTTTVSDGVIQLPEGMPDSLEEIPLPFTLDASRALIMSDVHVPHHSIYAVTEAVRKGLHFGVDTVLLNGDIMDNARLSDHAPDRKSRVRSWKYELDATRQFLQWIRTTFPKARIIYKYGNHETRFDRRVMAKMQEVEDVDEFYLHELQHLRTLGIEYVEEWRLIQAGQLYIMHGHELRASGMIPARNVRMKAHDNILIGHVHRTSEDPAKRIGGETFAGWSTGCLCSLWAKWLPVNQWNHGFALVEWSDGGSFRMDNRRIL